MRRTTVGRIALDAAAAGLWLAQRHTLRAAQPPIIIGGTGGSGTRVLVLVLQASGVFTGADLSPNLDSRPLGRFFRQWSKRRLARHSSAYVYTAWQKWWMLRALEAACLRHRHDMPQPEMPWAIKNPRAWLMLRELHERFPDMYFVQVVRDGRDMALSDNQRQVRKYGSHIIGRDFDDAPAPVRSIAYWSRMNIRLADLAAERLGRRHLIVRYEDLCLNPAPTIRALLQQLGLPTDAVDNAATQVRPPASLGRWRDAGPPLLEHMEATGRAGLARFGYL